MTDNSIINCKSICNTLGCENFGIEYFNFNVTVVICGGCSEFCETTIV